ncbi:MAG: hypothetical protein QOF58_287 [Pseudonocardiales bacterium]|nr:hypothetical protein [Pseudonocardiales bacterium]
MSKQTASANLAAGDPQPCELCGKPGWLCYYDASQARQSRIRWWQRKLPGPTPLPTIRRCDHDGDLGLYHLERPYLIEYNADVRIVRCPACELFAWRSPHEPDQCRSCYRSKTPAPEYWWEELLHPRSGLIRQGPRLRAALCSPSIAIPDVLRHAAQPVNAMGGLFVQGVGHCLQLSAAVPAAGAAIRAITENTNIGHDTWECRDMWRYAALLQGIAAGQLPLRQYTDVHALLHRVVVPATVNELLARVQVNAKLPYLWRVVGAVL